MALFRPIEILINARNGYPSIRVPEIATCYPLLMLFDHATEIATPTSLFITAATMAPPI